MGFGDEIMTTATAREMKLRHPRARIVVGDGKSDYWSIVFKNNPRLSRLSDVQPGEEVVWIHDYPGNRPYLPVNTPKRAVFNPDFRARPGELYFSEEESARARQLTQGLPPFVILEPHIKGGISNRNKDWGFEKWQRLVNAVGSQYFFVQMGPPDARTLSGVHRIQTPDFRTACAVLAHARACVLTEGGLHHAAAALGVPGVVIFGGFISPKTTGYDLHTNLFVEKGSPCGRNAPCRHCRRCMEAISVEQVAAALRERLAQSDASESRGAMLNSQPISGASPAKNAANNEGNSEYSR